MRLKLITGIVALALLLSPTTVASSTESESPATPPAEDWSGILRPGESLKDEAAGGNILVHQTDGNVVVYNVEGQPIWSTRTHGKDTSRLDVQPDGNFVLYDAANRPIFHTATHGTDARLTLQGDANLVMYEGTTVKWAALHWPPKPKTPPPGYGVPFTLRKIGWCEAGAYIGLPKYQTNYRAYNQQGSSASGGYQILDGTWAGWKQYVPEAVKYARAAHAPPHIQDQVATKAYYRHGTSPWNASRSCWG